MLLCSTGEDGVIRLWDAATGQALPELRGHVSWIRAICALPVAGDRQLIATAGDDGTVRRWDPVTGQPEQVMDAGRLGPITAVCAAPSRVGTLLASTGGDGSVRLWEPRTGNARGELRARVTANTDVCSLVEEGR